MKVYSCSSEISRREFVKIRSKLDLPYYTLGLIIFVTILVNAYGSIDVFIGAAVVGLVVMGLFEKGKSIFKAYKKVQNINFSENGIKYEEDATYAHWADLGKAREKDGWIMVKRISKVFLIKLENLSAEEEHFLRKRLRGLSK